MGWQDDTIVDQGGPWMHDPVVTPPSHLAVAGNAAMKGLAGFGDMFLNAPVNAYNVAKAGATLAGVKGLEITPQPNLVEKGMTAAGLIRPENEPQTPEQRVIDLAAQTGAGMVGNPLKAVGAIPKAIELGKNLLLGGTAGTAGGLTKEATGSDAAGLAASIAVPLLTHSATSSNANAPTLKNPVKLQAAKEGMEAGLVVPPSYIKPSFTANRIQSIAGKAAMDQEAQTRNVEAINNLARKAVGIPEGIPLTRELLDHIAEQAGTVYEKLRTLVPGKELRSLNVKTIEDRPMLAGPATGLDVRKIKSKAIPEKVITSSILDERGKPIIKETIPEQPAKMTGIKIGTVSRGQDVPGNLQGLKVKVSETRGTSPVDELKQVRADAKTYYRHNAISGHPASLTKAHALTKKATEIEDRLEKAAVASGNPQLMKEFRDARTLIAKTHAIEKSLNSGNVSPGVFARMIEKEEPLTGELAVIGRFAKAFPKAVREEAKIQSPGVSGTDAGMAAMLGTVGYGAAGGPAGMIAAGAPLLRSPARHYLLSKGYQGRLLKAPVPLEHAIAKAALAGRPFADQALQPAPQ